MPSFRPLVAALVLAVLPLLSARADRVDAFVPLGKTATVTVARPLDVATAAFEVQAAAKKLAITVKTAKGSKLALNVRLVAPDNTVYDAAAITAARGKVKAKSTLVTITLPTVPGLKAGLWRVEVRGATNTAGAATVLVKGTDAASIAKTQITVPALGSVTRDIVVGSNQALTVSISRGKGSSILPQLQILDPYGNALNGGALLGSLNTKKGSLSLKSFRLPVWGTYKLVVTGRNNGGGLISLSAKTAGAKAPRVAPKAVPGLPTETEPAADTSLNGTASSGASGGTLTYLWSQISGTPVTLTGPATSGPAFTAPATAGTLTFELAVQENGVWSAPAPVTVEVGPRPVADAGRSQTVATAAAVTLDGSHSIDRRGLGLSYSWSQDADDPPGAKVTLTGATTVAPTFTAPATPAVIHLLLVVDDGTIRSFEDSVTVRVGDTSQPTPDAGHDQVVPRMASVHLSALSTTTASGVLDAPVQWLQVFGSPNVGIDGSASLFPAFQAPKFQTDLQFQLTAGGATDTVWVRVRPSQTVLPPILIGGATQTIGSGNVTISASASQGAGETLSYRWAQVHGAALAPSALDVAAPTVNVPAGNATRSYAVQVYNGHAYSAPDLVAVRNTSYSGEPVANAGIDRTINMSLVPTPVAFLGGVSFVTQGSGPLTYRWRQISSTDWYDVDAKIASFDTTVGTPSFTFPNTVSSLTQRRTIVFELIVNDGVQDSAPDYMTVTFVNLPQNGKPTVTGSATPANPTALSLVQLSSTTPIDLDGDPTTVKWTPPAGITLSPNNRVANPTFTAPASGTLNFTVVANDGLEDGPPGNVQVIVDAAPTARFTINPSSAIPGTQITVDASTSTDPENHALTYTWSKVSGATLPEMPTDTTTAIWQFAAPSASSTIRLVVNDSRQNSAGVNGTFSLSAPVSASPTANPSNAGYGASVTLNAGASGTGPFTYTWSQLTSGANANDPVVTISSITAASPTFTVPKPTKAGGFGTAPSATLQVIVGNGVGTPDTKTVKVTFFASFNDGLSQGISANDTVNGMMQANCMGSSCHSGSSTKCSGLGYGMQGASTFHGNSVNITSCASTKKRVDTSSGSSASYLIDRLKGAGGTQMPQGASAFSVTQIAIIEDWINQGASSTN